MTQATIDKPIQTIVLDTNVIIHCLSTNLDLQIKARSLVLQYSQAGFLLCVNDVTFYECFKRLNPSRSTDFINFLNMFKQYFVGRDTLALAADLHCFFSTHEKVKDHLKNISTEDIIIGATSMLSGGYLLTTDFYDFPQPFFDMHNKHNLIYKDKNIEKMLPFYLLKADYDVFFDARAEWYKTKVPQGKPKAEI